MEIKIFNPDFSTAASIPLANSGVAAGFPSPAEGYADISLDLNKELVRNPSSTFFARVEGVSMQDDGINDGDLLVIDKSVEPYDNCVAVCFVDGDFTLKRIKFEDNHLFLVPANKNYKPIKITEDNDFTIWGVVRYVVKKV